MTNSTPNFQALSVFAGVNMDDSKKVASYIKSFAFDDLNHQSAFMKSFKSDLGVSMPKFAKILSCPLATAERFTFGLTAMKPINIRSLIMLLYVRSTDTALFNELISV